MGKTSDHGKLFDIAAEYLNVEPDALRSRVRSAALYEGRIAVWWVMSKRYRMHLKQIADVTGHDHSSVHHGLKRADALMRNPESLVRDVVAHLSYALMNGAAEPVPQVKSVTITAVDAVIAMGRTAEHLESLGHILATTAEAMKRLADEQLLAYQLLQDYESGTLPARPA